MKTGKNQAVWTSVILHVVVLVGVFLATIVEAFRPKEKEHVFVMVEPPSAQGAVSPPADSPPVDTPPDFQLPPVKPMDIPDPVIPTPPPVKAVPTPPTPTPQKPTPAPTKTPPPVKAAEPMMSAADFFKDNPKTAKPVKPTPSKPYVPQKIDTGQIDKSLRGLTDQVSETQSQSMTYAERTAFQRYKDQLNARLNRAWEKPASLAGIRLVATVVFDVSSSGRISNVQLRPSSGDAAFDRSVKAAFAKVGTGGVTPTGQGHTFTLSFKMVD